MHVGMKKTFLRKGEKEARIELGAGLAPQKGNGLPAVTREELLDEGIPFWRVDGILAQLSRWVERNPDRNEKELLLALARGYNRIE